ncbi:unnamed protein product [Protopolystoma xenopodis]|uniref:C-CAP/cofactor C-like domain-containing protein n=1 Tax=Protopolystoma xenopodis TaxID=117903 RepID=A0A3S4ZLV3_9PLAT|nr:unnamed protein product [Protopolystoma xenopodis]
MNSVTVDKCRKLTLLLGAVSRTLLLTACDDCLIISPARQVIVSSCRRCTLHLLTPSRPLLLQPPPPPLSGPLTPSATGGVGASGAYIGGNLSHSGSGLIADTVAMAGEAAGSTGTTACANVASGRNLASPAFGSSAGPIISSGALGNEDVVLAPYHTAYPRLLDHLTRAGLHRKVNFWDQPYLLGK